ncbi:MAG: chemotaxis response regulator protein-glutamate methylesterase [Phycisphaerales bacterium]
MTDPFATRTAAAHAKVRAVVVDDSAFMRKAISSMLSDDPEVEVVGVARNGAEGVKMARELKPDVMTMDIEMPEMDGLTALQKIMAECPTHVIMLSSLTTEGSHAALTALSHGAADVLAKEQSHISINIVKMKDELLRRVKALGRSRPPRKVLSSALPSKPKPQAVMPARLDLVCIGSSTGGPPVVEKLLKAVPADFAAPIIVAQHMPEVFTKSMAERLGTVCRVPVTHLTSGAALTPGRIHVCPGGQNTHLRRAIMNGRISFSVTVNREPTSTIYYPSVDALLFSAATAAGANVLSIILTGMGEDGVKGAAALKQAGGVILGQSAETCVVYGMPRAVYEKGIAAAMMSPEELADVLSTAGKNVLRKAG